ncbi:unnamed protein product [Allacma fusca]|uniref:Carnosine N-methyltransferase n=1 Tax=Allacma fusca TaxID=39272 RepID=A0A8J2JLN4_9HEXA|nr:unnamed protein product [Allacma fusca]
MNLRIRFISLFAICAVKLILGESPLPADDRMNTNDVKACKRRLEDPEWDDERIHFQKIVRTFGAYERYSRHKLKHTGCYIETLPPRHQELLSNYREHLKAMEKCVTENQEIFNSIVSEVSHMFENHDDVYSPNDKDTLPKLLPTVFDLDKLQAVLKQIYRDWSREGEQERDSCYTIIIEELERQFSQKKMKEDVRVLLPGAGLGRLAHEVVRRGYVTEGNEFSLFMLFTSNFILNKCQGVLAHTVYPFIHQITNNLNHNDQIRPISFPDIDTSDLPKNSRFSMTAGDFLDVYATPENTASWDAIVTCFFIDCAHNIVAMFERIYGCLKPGGVWINLGPLLYHFADMAGEDSIEPSFDFLVEIIKKLGFIIEKQLERVPTSYAENTQSMLRYSYHSVFLVCRKPCEPLTTLTHLLLSCRNSDPRFFRNYRLPMAYSGPPLHHYPRYRRSLSSELFIDEQLLSAWQQLESVSGRKLIFDDRSCFVASKSNGMQKLSTWRKLLSTETILRLNNQEYSSLVSALIGFMTRDPAACQFAKMATTTNSMQ